MTGQRGWEALREGRAGDMPSPFDGVVRSAEMDAEINKLFAKLFAGKRGELALSYLRGLTKDMVLGDGLNTTQLIHLEGQRFIVHLIERRAEHGRRSE